MIETKHEVLLKQGPEGKGSYGPQMLGRVDKNGKGAIQKKAL
jgi:hypothetical protein